MYTYIPKLLLIGNVLLELAEYVPDDHFVGFRWINLLLSIFDLVVCNSGGFATHPLSPKSVDHLSSRPIRSHQLTRLLTLN